MHPNSNSDKTKTAGSVSCMPLSATPLTSKLNILKVEGVTWKVIYIICEETYLAYSIIIGGGVGILHPSPNYGKSWFVETGKM